LSLFERLYIVYKIIPYTNKISRAIQKQPKHYLYDWSEVQDEGSRFENFVASHLWKAVQIWTDLGYANLSLHFLRDRDNREVDFLIVKDRRPWFLVECKLSDTQLSENLRYFSQRLNVPGIQLVWQKNTIKILGNCSIISADRWLGKLP
jgi:predicted AAA+ superfamily ATPase